MTLSAGEWVAVQYLYWGQTGGLSLPSAPRNLRYQHGAFGVRFAYDAPSTWGRDAGGAETRRYERQVRELDDDGNVIAGVDWDDPPAPSTSTDLEATYSASAADRHFEFRVRAINRRGRVSVWAYETAPVTEPQRGALRMDRRFLRIDNERLRLT